MAESSMMRLEEELKRSKSKKLKYYLAGGLLALAVLILILVLALKPKNNGGGGDNPPTPPPQPDVNTDYVVNPYSLKTDEKSALYGTRKYTLVRNQSMSVNFTRGMAAGAQETQHNQFVEEATMETSVHGHFDIMRVKIGGANTTELQQMIANEYLSPEFLSIANKSSLNHDEMNRQFAVWTDTSSAIRTNKSQFGISATHYETSPSMVEVFEFLSSQD
jgi:hypothetical protein